MSLARILKEIKGKTTEEIQDLDSILGSLQLNRRGLLDYMDRTKELRRDIEVI